MNLLELLLRRALLGGEGGLRLENLEFYAADFVAEPPTVTSGSVDKWNRALVA